jgi:basic membrane lipoprotein Med (substrate-binding protein (PBP1-ABC) superfamily)
MKRNLTRRSFLTAISVAAVAVPAGVSVAQGAKITVAGAYIQPVEQQWISRIHVALKAAADRGDIEYVWSENVSTTDIERVVREYAAKGIQLIVGDSFATERAFRKMAEELPGTKFLMGSAFGPQGDNYAVFDNYIHEASYLTGMIAGGMTKNKIIGMVGGYPIPEVNRLMQAFMDGALEVNPDTKFVVSFIGSWYDPPKAKEAALAQIDKGADVLYAERFGVTDAAQERKILAIGSVIDTQPQYPDTIIASALWHMEPTINRAIEKMKNSTFTGEDYGHYSTMPYGGASLAPLGAFESKVPEDLKARVAKREAEIKSGDFQVIRDDSEPRSTL